MENETIEAILRKLEDWYLEILAARGVVSSYRGLQCPTMPEFLANVAQLKRSMRDSSLGPSVHLASFDAFRQQIFVAQDATQVLQALRASLPEIY